MGVDALGFVFYDRSPRHIDIEQASEIINQLPGFVTTVGLFLNPGEGYVKQVLENVDIDLLQFHGTEPAVFCESFNRPYIKALGIAGVDDISGLTAKYSSARSVLLDSHGAGKAGGTGETFNWKAIPLEIRDKIILAGGLNPENVAEAIEQLHPYALDLSSGVEQAPGIKDKELMARLMSEVQRADSE